MSQFDPATLRHVETRNLWWKLHDAFERAARAGDAAEAWAYDWIRTDIETHGQKWPQIMTRTFNFKATEILEVGNRTCVLKLHVEFPDDPAPASPTAQPGMGQIVGVEEVQIGYTENQPDHWPAD